MNALREAAAVVNPGDVTPPPDQINGLIERYNRGQLLEVLKRGKVLAEQYPTAIIIHNILGAVNAGLGRPTEAIVSYTKALQINPDLADVHSNLGEAFKDLGKLDEAIASYTKALKIKPDYAPAHNNLGTALKGLGRLDEAVASYTKALEIEPAISEAHNNLGVALKAQGRIEEAIASYTKALKIKPAFAEAHNNLGVALNDLGKHEQAIASYTKALKIKPDYAEAHNDLGAALRNLGRQNEAIESYVKALQIKPAFAEAHNNLGVALNDLGRHDEAIESYAKGLRIKPDYSDAYSNLCSLYEKLNRVADLENALNCAKKNCAEDDAGILFHRARLESRKENNDGVVDLLKTISPEKFLPEIQEEYFSFLGKTYDKMGKYNLAFATFEIQNEISRSLISSQRDNAETYFNNTIQLKQSWTSGNQLDWSAARTKVEDISLAFLVGFPRSGTTLLDSILRSHPGITVVEEKPMVDNMRKLFGRIPSISELNKLTDSDITVLKNEYINELKAYVDKSRISKLIIDKLPLNIRNVGLIHRVFPKAKFILSLRHPCDCVLSCFMQNFRINDAMANFLTLDQSAKLYAAVMELWQGYQNSLDLEVGVLKYEELVQDLRGTCMPLIHFLKLDWDDNLINYQETAKNRGRINTPSYNQVIQPLYRQASGRWENYRDQMAPVLPILEPWIEEFGYRD